ncbi:MAG: 16S rRNA (guanine(527)-N(7))-methyltransferase RsmG [Polyangia bacterium]
MLSETDRDRLRRGAAALDVALTAAQEHILCRYVERLLAWNQKLNLTAVTDPTAIVDKHLLDALALVPVFRDRAPADLLDVGTGPGLPAIVLATMIPGLRVTAVESIQKKATFVRTISRELGYPVEVKAVRLEHLDRGLTWDLAVSRATFEPTEWVERARYLVRPGGLLVAMMSEHQTIPAAPAGYIAEPLLEHQIGGVLRRIATYSRAFHVEP